MTLEAIRAPVRDDLRAVDAAIRARLHSAVPLVDQIAEHIIAGGGKRLRPLLVVLSARACAVEGVAHIEAAAFIEFIHTDCSVATLRFLFMRRRPHRATGFHRVLSLRDALARRRRRRLIHAPWASHR